MTKKTLLSKAIKLAVAGSTLTFGIAQPVVASTTMYNLQNASEIPRISDGPVYPDDGAQDGGTDGWVWGGTGTVSNGDPYAADPGWLGTLAGQTYSKYAPFGTTKAMALNWAAHITQAGHSLEISQAEAVARFGQGMIDELGSIYYPDIDTAGGAWDQKLPGNNADHGWRHNIDIGLFKSEVTQNINLQIIGVAHPEDNFGITVYTGLSSSEDFYNHHGNYYGANGLPYEGMPVLTYTLQDPSTKLTSNSLSFTAEAGQIYTIVLGGNNGENWSGKYDSYVLNINTSPVPLPGAVWLFGSALAGFVGVQRRKKRAI